MTIADSQLVTTLTSAFINLVGQQQQKQLPSVMRWFQTCVQQPLLAPFVGKHAWCSVVWPFLVNFKVQLLPLGALCSTWLWLAVWFIVWNLRVCSCIHNVTSLALLMLNIITAQCASSFLLCSLTICCKPTGQQELHTSIIHCDACYMFSPFMLTPAHVNFSALNKSLLQIAL